MGRVFAGAVILFVAVVLFHLAAHDRLQNLQTAWQRLQSSGSGAGATF